MSRGGWWCLPPASPHPAKRGDTDISPQSLEAGSDPHGSTGWCQLNSPPSSELQEITGLGAVHSVSWMTGADKTEPVTEVLLANNTLCPNHKSLLHFILEVSLQAPRGEGAAPSDPRPPPATLQLHRDPH